MTLQFLDPPADAACEHPKVLIIPAPYEATTSYGQGTGQGPQAILEASAQVEFYDDELDCEPFRVGIATTPSVDFTGVSGEAAIHRVEASVAAALKRGAWPLVLGGEHSITTGAVRACRAQHPAMGVVQIDAHADLRESYGGTTWSHASVMRRILQLGCPSVGIGIRALCQEERTVIRECHLPRWFGYQVAQDDTWMDAAIAACPPEVFLTFDVDGLDPSILRATGTPVPGGLQWYPTLRFLRRLFQARRVVGADVVELAPTDGDHASNFVAAQLTYKLIGYWATARSA